MNIFNKIGMSFGCTQDQKSYSDEGIWESENDGRTQETDDAFFEILGFVFQEQTELAAKQELEQKEVVALAAANATSVLGQDEPAIRTLSEYDTDGDTTSSSGSDTEEQNDKSDITGCALNREELYSEILYEILHYVGCDVNCDIAQTALFSYIQEAFWVSNDFHQCQLDFAEKKQAPDILLNVEVVEAKDLPPMDSNGLSDPFVTLYLASDTADKYNTSVKTCTLTPVWKENFALTVPGTSSEDSLCLDVWDFDEAETVKGKMRKIFEVKGLKGLKKYKEEMLATGQQMELIGSARIPLITVPTLGMTKWYRLDREKEVASQGIIKVRVTFSSAKNKQVAKQEHRHLLRIILSHELETSKVARRCWCGSFSPQGNAVLTQHIVQSGLTPLQVAICQWSVYVNMHIDGALSFALFSNLLDELINPLQPESVSDNDVRIFWDASKKLLPSCFSIIRKMRKKTADKTLLNTITEVVILLSQLSTLEPLAKINLFPLNLYTWLEPRQKYTIAQVLKDAVLQGARNWSNCILENNRGLEDNGIAKLQFIIQTIHLVRGDIQNAIGFFEKIFQEYMDLKYVKQLYISYKEKISALTEEDAISACKTLPKLTFTGQTNHKEHILQGTKLFEAYMALQRFVALGKRVCPFDCFRITNFYEWFYSGVVQWLDLSGYKALVRINKAVALDFLVPVDDSVNYSCSYVDTQNIFNQVRVFWQQLYWTNLESCYTFFARIIDNICHCSVFFAQKMAERGNELGIVKNIDGDWFEVTNKLCLSINNIEHISQALVLFSVDLGMEDVIQKLSYQTSSLDAETCQQTLNNVIAKSVDTINNEINELLVALTFMMLPAMKRLLIEGAELFNKDINSIDRLMTYVDNNLRTLNEGLNEENFNSTLMAIWEELGKILEEIIEAYLDKMRPPEFYANLQRTLDLMLGSFEKPDDCDSMRRSEALLKIHGLETTDLIHQVHLDLWEENMQVNESPYGVLTVRFKFEGNTLQVEMMNAKNLIPMDSNGSYDSFVRVYILPEHKFRNIQMLPKSQIHESTIFPSCDETFELNLTKEQRNIGNGLLLFRVENEDLLGYDNKHVGEAIIHFKDIPDTNTPLTSIPQIHLQLIRPKTKATDAVKALEHRQGDELAKNFLNNFRQRMESTQ